MQCSQQPDGSCRSQRSVTGKRNRNGLGMDSEEGSEDIPRLEFCYTKLPRGAATAISPAGPEPHHSRGEGECHDPSHDRRGSSSQEPDKMPRRSRLFRFASIKQWHLGNLKQRVGCKPKAAAQSDHSMGILKADVAQTVATCLVTAWARTQSQQPLSEGRQSIPSPLMSPRRSSFQAQGGKCPLQRQAVS
jgi:hypothetical protein